MPDTIRKVDYYYITASDKPGEGARVLGALRDAGVNLLAVHAFPSARRSQIDVVPSDPAAFVNAAKAAGVKISKPKTVFLVEADDRAGAMAATLDRDADGNLVRKAGLMSIVIAEGDVRPGDAIGVEMPALPHRPLQPV